MLIQDMNQNIQINTETNNKRTIQVAPPQDKEKGPTDNFIQNQVDINKSETNIRSKYDAKCK